VDPKETVAQELASDPAPRLPKSSKLITFEQHANWITDESVRAAFVRVAQCFTSENDDRSDWVLANVKGEHVAVHYKGEYLIHLWARRGYFYAGFEIDGQARRIRIDATNLASQMPLIERDCRTLMATVDTNTAIPAEFTWRSAK
jgi:hypothetical protein